MKKNKEVGLFHGNLLDFPYGINTIAHCCNILNVMSDGIAGQIAERYPEAKEADDVAEKSGRNDLGDFSFAEVEIENSVSFPHQEFGKDIRKCQIYNLYTIESLGPGREINYEALYRNYAMGCGLAGGNWQIVSAMIYAIFESPATYFKTYIVKYES